ncbi:hypothetical protein, partial [Salmonella enterica]|uniref:hypothetical protein n=1 Tax=Salmonella enterica TaxID=28901 RepID=UPI0020C51654
LGDDIEDAVTSVSASSRKRGRAAATTTTTTSTDTKTGVKTETEEMIPAAKTARRKPARVIKGEGAGGRAVVEPPSG